MKTRILFIALLLLTFASCKKDDPEPTPAPINYFVNKSWESINPLGLSITIEFISETECKWTSKVPLFAPITSFVNYTFKEYKANLIDKNTGKVIWVCVINGGSFSLEGRNEIFTRTK